MNSRILVVDDDEKIVNILRLYLERESYQVLTAYDGLTALSLARHKQPHLILLDWLLPHLDGLDICRILRAESPIPIILLTARSTEEDMLLGLDQGADDYLTKPFRPREVLARVRAVLRRTHVEQAEPLTVLQQGKLQVNLLTHEVSFQGKHIALTPTEFALLETFMKEPGRVFRREVLLRLVFGSIYEGFERTIDVHIMNLRKKIEVQADVPQYIQTVYGIGYKFLSEPNYEKQ